MSDKSRRSSMSFAIGGLGHWDPEKDRAHIQYPPWGWTCFHCGMHFSSSFWGVVQAQRHFGKDPENDVPACVGAAFSMVEALRTAFRAGKGQDLPETVSLELVRIDDMRKAVERRRAVSRAALPKDQPHAY